ncbi:MAG TPA: DUF664 domain-containing protein [Micromonosporaceae bacterium]|jgi:hypothetical protein
MTEVTTLTEAYSRLPDLVRRACDGLSADQLAWAPAEGANSIGWLIWHLTRIQDHHVSQLSGQEQAWAAGPWAEQLGRDADPEDTGFAHKPADVASIRPPSADVLIGYYDTVHDRTMTTIATITPEDLDRVVDRDWDPPVTMRVRLISVLGDDLQHVGQAAYIRGLLPG